MPRSRTERIPAVELKVGDVFFESPGNAARVFDRNATGRGVHLRARYVWTPVTEYAWRISFKNDDPVTRVTPKTTNKQNRKQ